MKLGDRTEISRRFSRSDIDAYVTLGGAPPLDDAIPEPMIAALFSYLLGVNLPGPGTNYLKQSLDFHAAAKLDSTLRAWVTVTRLRPEKALVDLETSCFDESSRLICTGRALVRVKDVDAG